MCDCLWCLGSNTSRSQGTAVEDARRWSEICRRSVGSSGCVDPSCGGVWDEGAGGEGLFSSLASVTGGRKGRDGAARDSCLLLYLVLQVFEFLDCGGVGGAAVHVLVEGAYVRIEFPVDRVLASVTGQVSDAQTLQYAALHFQVAGRQT